jgi:hypothetical protein
VKRVIVAGLLLLTIAGITGQARQADAEAQQRESRREKQCRFQWVERGTWTAREERLTLECVVAKYPVPGGITQMNCVAIHESGWNRFAYNPNGHAGLFQHDTGAWPGRVETWEPYWWTLDSRWTNSRSQIVVTARMARSDGDWDQWTVC